MFFSQEFLSVSPWSTKIGEKKEKTDEEGNCREKGKDESASRQLKKFSFSMAVLSCVNVPNAHRNCVIFKNKENMGKYPQNRVVSSSRNKGR